MSFDRGISTFQNGTHQGFTKMGKYDPSTGHPLKQNEKYQNNFRNSPKWPTPLTPQSKIQSKTTPSSLKCVKNVTIFSKIDNFKIIYTVDPRLPRYFRPDISCSISFIPLFYYLFLKFPENVWNLGLISFSWAENEKGQKHVMSIGTV